MSNNIQRAVAIGADFKAAYTYAAWARNGLEAVLNAGEITLTLTQRHKLGECLEILQEMQNSNSIHRAIEYAENELK